MRKLALIILDGFGMGEAKPNNAIHMAQTPFFDKIWKTYPHTILQASGEYVGLPEGQIGGSEVGHLTIGAGRVMYQQLPRINKQIQGENAEIMDLTVFKEFLEKSKQRTPHLIGQVSTGGVHSYETHLYELLRIMKQYGCLEPYIHVITDGRDTPPRSSLLSIDKLTNVIKKYSYGKIATVSGRFYAMDRDNNLDRTEKAAAVMTSKLSVKANSDRLKLAQTLHETVQRSHKQKITDEFVIPVRIDQNASIRPDNILFFFNFRADRMKQIVTMLSKQTHVPDNNIYTMTRYDSTYPFQVIFEKETLDNTIGSVLSKLNLKQLRAAETEKAPHITYFFSGGKEEIFAHERRTVAESNKVTHDKMPLMKSAEILKNVQKEVESHYPDFILVNFANPDMVGHTGIFQAVIDGVEHVDATLQTLCAYLTKHHYICLITADHGNADIMYDLETMEPHTAHTLNPVPFIVYDPTDTKNKHIKLNQNPANGLSLIAGTALELMEVKHNHDHFRSLIRKS